MPVARSMCVCVFKSVAVVAAKYLIELPPCLEVHTKKPTDHFLGVALSERSGNDRSRHRDLSLSRSGTGQTQGGWVAKFMGQCCRKLQNQMIIKHDLPEEDQNARRMNQLHKVATDLTSCFL